MHLHIYTDVFSVSQEDSFHLVDNKPAQRKQGMRRFQPNRCAQDCMLHQASQPWHADHCL